jgi:hypothetical protein
MLQVYAYDAGDKDLTKKVDVSKNKMVKSKDSDLINKCKTIWKQAKKLYGLSLDTDIKKVKAKKNFINISSYGLTGTMIDALEEANKKFIESVLDLKDAIAYRNKCTRKIKSKLKDNDKILTRKIDKLVNTFEFTDNGFFKDYKEARKMILPEKPAEAPKAEKKPEQKVTKASEKPGQKQVAAKRGTEGRAAGAKKQQVTKKPEPGTAEENKPAASLAANKTGTSASK